MKNLYTIQTPSSNCSTSQRNKTYFPVKKLSALAIIFFAGISNIIAQSRLTDLYPGANSSSIANLYLDPTSQFIYFTAKSSASDQEWYKVKVSDNTITKVTSDFSDYSGGVIMRPTFRVGDNIFFSGAKGFNGLNPDLEFNRFNLTNETFQYLNIHPSSSSDPYGGFVADENGNIYFLASNATGMDIYRWKKSDSSITNVSNRPGTNSWYPSQNAGIAYSNGYLYFESYLSNSGCPSSCSVTNNEPVRYKISDNTYTTFDLDATTPATGSSVRALKLFNNSKVVFDARVAGTGNPRQVFIINPLSPTDVPLQLTNFAGTNADGDIGGYLDGNNGKVYYYADAVDTRREIYVADIAANTNTKLTNFDVASTFVIPMFLYNGFLYFSWRNGASGSIKKIKLSDNTITDVSTGYTAAPTNATLVGKYAYFQATTSGNGSELWQVELTTETSTRMTDINANALNSVTGKPLFIAGKIYFAATEATYSQELYTMNVVATLPLNLTRFNGKIMSQSAILDWRTVNEVSTKEFIVEYSTDGSSFSPVGTIAAKGDGNGQYSFSYPGVTGNNYYRLKMIDKDGKFTYSDIVKIILQDKKTGLAIFPNPVSDKLFLDINNSNQTKQITYTIYDALGNAIQKGPANKAGEGINVQQLRKGSYSVQLSDGQSGKFIKQ